MIDNTDKVVKCKNCGQHFMYTKKAIKCPFCYTVFNEVQEKVAEKTVAEKAVEEKAKSKKVTVKTQKESFKVWN